MTAQENFSPILQLLNNNAHREVLSCDVETGYAPKRVPELETGGVRYDVPGDLTVRLSVTFGEPKTGPVRAIGYRTRKYASNADKSNVEFDLEDGRDGSDWEDDRTRTKYE